MDQLQGDDLRVRVWAVLKKKRVQPCVVGMLGVWVSVCGCVHVFVCVSLLGVGFGVGVGLGVCVGAGCVLVCKVGVRCMGRLAGSVLVDIVAISQEVMIVVLAYSLLYSNPATGRNVLCVVFFFVWRFAAVDLLHLQTFFAVSVSLFGSISALPLHDALKLEPEFVEP